MAPNRRSVPTSLSLSDSSDPESWSSATITTNDSNGKSLASETPNGSQNEHPNNSTGHYVNAKMMNLNQLNNNHINRIQVNSCVNVSSSTQGTSITTTSSSSSSSSNHNHNSWRNWPKIDLISSIDPFESTDSMISAFACVAHVINSDSANEDDQIDGDNEIIGMTEDNSDHGNDGDDDDNGSYDSSNHPNSLESPESYRPIHKPQSMGYKSINNQFNGKTSSSHDRYSNKTDKVNTIKPSPPPLSTIPRPSQQPPPPPTSTTTSLSSSTVKILTPTPISNQIKSPTTTSKSIVTSSSSVATSVTAKDHLYETIYPSNIRLTRDSKYFVDYQNYRSILSQPVEPVSPSLDIPVGGRISIKVNQTNTSNDIHSSSTDLINSKEMVRRSTYSSSTVAGKSSYKNVTGRVPTSSTVNKSYNQPRSIHYNQTQKSKPHAYNYHHPHHQHHLPGHSNSSSLYKPSISSSSSSLLSPPPPSSPSPLTESNHNQGDRNQRIMKKLPETSSIHQNNYHSTTKSSSVVTISRPTYLPFNKLNNNTSYDEVDGKSNNKSTIENKVANDNPSSSKEITTIEKDKTTSNQTQLIKLKPDQVYPNPISMPVISRANVRSTEEYATVNKARAIRSMKSATLTPSSPVNSYNDEFKLISKDDSILRSESKRKESIESPMSLTSLSTSSPASSPSTSSMGNSLLDTKQRSGKGKSKDKSLSSPLSQSASSSSSRSFLSKFFSLTHVISRTFSVEKIDKHHRSLNIHDKGTLIKSAVSTPALSSSTKSAFFSDLNGNSQTRNHFPSTRTLIDSPTCTNQENVEPVSLSSNSGSKSLQTKSSSSFVRAFKNRLSLRRSRRKVKVKVDVTRTKSDPRSSKTNRYEDDLMIPKQSPKDETIYGSIVAISGDFMKIVEIHRPQGKPFGFFVARGTVNNVKGIFISRIDSNGEKAYHGLLEIGDRLIEIDGNDVTEASVIQVNQLMSNKTKLTLKIVPFSVITDAFKA